MWYLINKLDEVNCYSLDFVGITILTFPHHKRQGFVGLTRNISKKQISSKKISSTHVTILTSRWIELQFVKSLNLSNKIVAKICHRRYHLQPKCVLEREEMDERT